MSSQKQRVGVSIITLFFIVCPLFPKYGQRLNTFCEQTGIGLQLVPFWFMSISDILAIYSHNVISYEDAWNADETFSMLCSRIFCFWKNTWDPAAILAPLLFGFQKHSSLRLDFFRKRFTSALAVDTFGTNHELTETSPSNWDEILTLIPYQDYVCLDTWHIRNNSVSTFHTLQGLARIHELFADHNTTCVKLIHLQTRSREELRNFVCFTRQESFLKEALEIILPAKGEISIPIIIELLPCKEETLLAVRDEIITIAALKNGTYWTKIIHNSPALNDDMLSNE